MKPDTVIKRVNSDGAVHYRIGRSKHVFNDKRDAIQFKRDMVKVHCSSTSKDHESRRLKLKRLLKRGVVILMSSDNDGFNYKVPPTLKVDRK